MTDSRINVCVVKRKGRNLYLRYTDPVDGKRHERNSGTKSMKAAQRAAGEWQVEINAGGLTAPKSMTWSEFRQLFDEGHLAHYSVGYQVDLSSTLNIVEQLMSPDKLTRINERWLARLYSLLKYRKAQGTERVISPRTLIKHFKYLRVALSFAVEHGFIKDLPKFPKVDKVRGGRLMKGRPITGEEFERMLAAVDKTIVLAATATRQQLQEHSEAAASLRHLLTGLWLSGLRLGEALKLTWDQWGDGIRVRVDSDGDVCLLIDAEDQKNRQTMVYPVIDEFARFLLETPPEERTGFVFNPRGSRGSSRKVKPVSSWISAIGRKARVKVNTRDGVNKYASAHDLRRAFGTRWAMIVPALLLQKLMRHASLDTTLNYYVELEAKATITEIRRHLERQRGDSGGDSGDHRRPAPSVFR